MKPPSTCSKLLLQPVKNFGVPSYPHLFTKASLIYTDTIRGIRCLIEVLVLTKKMIVEHHVSSRRLSYFKEKLKTLILQIDVSCI